MLPRITATARTQQMSPSPRTLIGLVTPARWLGWAVVLVASVIGAVYGYGFGLQVGGSMWLAVVAAANGALFCSLIADAVFTRVMRWRMAARAPQRPRDAP